ncbi:efflux transporter outer membrane subunit [Hyphococcus sp.]|uniref:efflux transporter outer membrane subunit n=1 Tax=Hyphococcus sp. TaxID=2038636 RepID=UPI003D13E422
MPLIKTLFASASILTITACASIGPEYEAPSTNNIAGIAFEGDPAVDASISEPAQSWWRALEDETLNALIERAFAENRDLRIAAANVEAARAQLRIERVNLRPTAEGTADYQRRRLSGASFGADDLSFNDSDFFDVGLNAAWELDFFGRVKNATRAALAEAQGAEYLRRDAEALVAAETARAYVDYRGAQTSLSVAERNLEIQRETSALTQTRYEEGLGTKLDVARAQTQAKITQASIPPLEAAQTAALNRLATLTGAPAEEVKNILIQSAEDLPAPPEALAIGDAESLLRRRADIRAAERTLAAATAQIGVAKADYFPRITLVGAVSASAQTLSGVGGDGSFGYGVGPSLSWTGFDIPRVRANIKAADARADAAFAAYEQTVLTALEETRTALADYGRERARLDALDDAAATAREAAGLARDRYDAGADDFIDVLDAEGRLLAAEASLAESRRAAASKFISVYLALGAGWRAETVGRVAAL